MNSRIKKIRKALDMSQANFASSINLQRNSLSLIENGARNPSDRTISDICRVHHVSEKWLRTGEGEMFEAQPSSAIDELAAAYGLNEADRLIVERFVQLSKENRDAVTNYMKEIAKALNEIDSKDDTEAAEAAYREALGIAPQQGSTASNTTEDTETIQEESVS